MTSPRPGKSPTACSFSRGGAIVADGSPDSLRLAMSRTSEVRYTRDGVTEVHACEDPVDFLRGVLTSPGERITDLEVRRAGLEDAYLDLVRCVEGGEDHGAVLTLRPLGTDDEGAVL